MSDTRRVFTQAEVHFKKSNAAAIGPVLASLGAVGGLYAAGRSPSFSLVASLPLVYSLVDLVWSRVYPMLSIAPGKITHRSQFWRRAVEISRAEITAWRVTGKHLIIECARKKPVKVNLELLSKRDRVLAPTVLRERGYGNLES